MKIILIGVLLFLLAVFIVKLILCLKDLFASTTNRHKIRDIAKIVKQTYDERSILILTTVDVINDSEFKSFILYTIKKRFDIEIDEKNGKYCFLQIPNQTLFEGISLSTIDFFKDKYSVYTSTINILDKCVLLIPNEYFKENK